MIERGCDSGDVIAKRLLREKDRADQRLDDPAAGHIAQGQSDRIGDGKDWREEQRERKNAAQPGFERRDIARVEGRHRGGRSASRSTPPDDRSGDRASPDSR